MNKNKLLNAIDLLTSYTDKMEAKDNITLDEARIIEEALDILSVCVEDNEEE